MSPCRTKKRAQEGYALLMIMFFLAMLVLSMAAAAPTVPEQLQQLAELRDKGIITAAEFETKKAQLLERM